MTESIFRRRDVSPRLFRQLVTQATEAVREKLMHNARPEQEAALKQVLDEISTELVTREEACPFRVQELGVPATNTPAASPAGRIAPAVREEESDGQPEHGHREQRQQYGRDELGGLLGPVRVAG